MESKSRKLYPWVRKFGYYNIFWKVKNFSFSSCGDDGGALETPQFYISGPQLTKWMLILRPKMVGGEKCIVFSLKRVRSDNGPDVVWVQWRSWIKWLENDGEKHHFLSEHEHRFKKNRIFDSDKIQMNNFLQNLQSMEHDRFEVKCQLVFYLEHDSYISSNACTDASLKSLSRALSNLFKIGKGHDMAVATNGQIIPAHKAILHYRNKVLAEMIETKLEKGIVDLPDVKYEGVRSAVRYLYSGNVDAFLRRPTFAKNELTSLLNIWEANGCYILDNLTIESKYSIDKCSTDWLIKHYSTGSKVVRSSRVIESGLNFRCVLHLCPYGIELNSDYATLYFEVISGETPRILSLEISILNHKMESINTKKFWAKLSMVGIIMQNFASRGTILSALVNDTLRIRIKILASTPCNWVTHLSYDNDLHERDVVDCYRKLSRDMAFMFEEGKYADITLQAENTIYKAHKFMLFARSTVLATMMDQDSITIPHMKPHILRILLYYIYTGDLIDYEFLDLIVIYEYADVFGIDNLRISCSKLLKDAINFQFVFDILKCSKDRQDKNLKRMALNFISENIEQISQEPRWEQIMKDETSLWKEIMTFCEKEDEE